jgi:hypothetical protein
MNFAIFGLLVEGAPNGRALLPPMGWRSWNCFYADIDDAKIRAQVDALVKPRDEAGTSLLSLGYRSIGIDEGWEGCKLGVNGTVHYANGTPAVDPKRFPDLPALVRYAKLRGVAMGFYLNGCGCNEKEEKVVNYEGDVRATVAWGFDAVKIDSCGAQKNMTLYGELFNASGTAIEIENCHQGRNLTDGGNPGQSARRCLKRCARACAPARERPSVPHPPQLRPRPRIAVGDGWCPYNTFRTSGDITNLWDRVMANLLTVVPFLSPDAASGRPSLPLSRPGCFAYPDMLEVGRSAPSAARALALTARRPPPRCTKPSSHGPWPRKA